LFNNEFNAEKFKRIFGQDHYLHASGQNAAAIMAHIKKGLAANGSVKVQ